MTSKRVLTGIFLLFVLATLAACGGGGGSSAAPAPNDVPRFAYAANYLDNTVSIYTVNPATGQLRHNGYIAAGTNPASVSVDPSGKFAYVANFGGGISAYRINASTGALTQIDAAPGLGGIQNFPAGTNPRFVTVDATGKFVYVANSGSNSVSAYSINAATGALTTLADVDAGAPGIQSSIATGPNPSSFTIDPSGKFAYVANFGANYVSIYSINADSGALTSVGTSSVVIGTSNPSSVTVDPTGKFAYVANRGSNDVSAYRINASTGALINVGTVVAGNNPESVTVDASGKFAYVTNWGSGYVLAYSINATTGALTTLADVNAGFPGNQPTIAAGTNPTFVTIDPSGKFVYVANYTSETVSVYSIDATTGALIGLPSVTGRKGLYALAISKGAVAVTYTPKFVYVANEDSNNISAYLIDASTGALTSAGTTTAVVGRNTPLTVTVDPFGKFAYVANNGSNDVSAYSINPSTGALTHVGTVVAGTSPASVSVDPSGKFAYVANRGSGLGVSGSVSAYIVDAGTGLLTVVAGPYVAEGQPTSITIDPAGKFVYVANRIGVLAFAINAGTGALTPIDANPVAAGIQSFPTGDDPWSVTVDPTGQYVYATNFGSRDVTFFSINAATGALTAIVASPEVAGYGPISIAIGPSGKFAYVTNLHSRSVWVYSIYPTYPSAGRMTAIDIVSGDYSMYLPWSITVDPSGKFAYVAASAGVLAYSLDATTGAMTSIGTIAAGTGPRSITTTGTIQ